jgi:hypothetical protein
MANSRHDMWHSSSPKHQDPCPLLISDTAEPQCIMHPGHRVLVRRRGHELTDRRLFSGFLLCQCLKPLLISDTAEPQYPSSTGKAGNRRIDADQSTHGLGNTSRMRRNLVILLFSPFLFVLITVLFFSPGLHYDSWPRRLTSTR